VKIKEKLAQIPQIVHVPPLNREHGKQSSRYTSTMLSLAIPDV
jgi:hypothetical protein